MFKDGYGFKTLDSRLRGNDGMGIAIYFNLFWKAGFRRPL